MLLRAVAGGAATGLGGSYLAHGAGAEPAAASWALGLLAVLSGIGLMAGFMTPAAAAVVSISMLIIALTWTPLFLVGLVIGRPAAALVIVDAVALALLGPGAHSIDAWLFGRREIFIPHKDL